LQEETNDPIEIVQLTTQIVSSYVSNNPVPVADLPDLIASIHSSLAGIGRRPEPEPQVLVPAVNPKRSVQPDYIISLEDGRRLKAMKRYLRGLGMTPDEYRTKWGLAREYPMVAPNYAARRSELAKASGLGRKAAPVAPANNAPAKRRTKA